MFATTGAAMKSDDTHSQQIEIASTLDGHLVDYGRHLGDVLTKGRSTCWYRRDPELQKILERLYGAVDELLRQHHLASVQTPTHHGSPLSPRLDENHCQRILLQLETDPANLTLDLAIEVLDVLDQILIEIGDAGFVCKAIQDDLQWHRGSTTWVTWDSMKFHPTPPKAVTDKLAGKHVDAVDLAAARHQLASFRHTRSNKYQADRARQKERARNLHLLAVVLLLLVTSLVWSLAMCCETPILPLGLGTLVAASGGLGSAVSGAFKARDRLIRTNDLRAFRSGLPAQVLLGATAAVLVVLVLLSGVLKIAGTEALAGLAAIGFGAGFSEPFFLKTVERLLGSGDEKPGEATATTK